MWTHGPIDHVAILKGRDGPCVVRGHCVLVAGAMRGLKRREARPACLQDADATILTSVTALSDPRVQAVLCPQVFDAVRARAQASQQDALLAEDASERRQWRRPYHDSQTHHTAMYLRDSGGAYRTT